MLYGVEPILEQLKELSHLSLVREWCSGKKVILGYHQQGFSTQQSNPNAKICAMSSNYLARGYQGFHVKQANRKKKVTNTLTQRFAQLR